MSETTTADKRISRSRVRKAARNATSLPSTAVSLATIRGSESVDLADRIEFNFRGSWTDSEVVLDLRNNNNRNRLAYKVKTTSNRLIRIRSARGFIEPEYSTCVRLKLRDIDALSKAQENGVDVVVVVFAICVAECEEDAVVAWSYADRNEAPMWEKKLAVVLTNEEEEEAMDENGFEEGAKDEKVEPVKGDLEDGVVGDVVL